MIEYRTISAGELGHELFRSFIRRQVVVKCWRRDNGQWMVRDDPFIDDWPEKDYGFLVSCLKNTVGTGGLVLGQGNGRKKLYISAHWAVDSQTFYRKMGCTEAREYNQRHVEAEPFDCQMECGLWQSEMRRWGQGAVKGPLCSLSRKFSRSQKNHRHRAKTVI